MPGPRDPGRKAMLISIDEQIESTEKYLADLKAQKEALEAEQASEEADTE